MDVFYRDYLAQEDHTVSDEPLGRALDSLEGAALKFSSGFIKDAKLRENYNSNVQRVRLQVLSQVKAGNVTVKEAAEFCYQARNKIMAETRKHTSVPGLAIAEQRKAVSPTLEALLDEKAQKKFGRRFLELAGDQKNSMYYEIIESSARPNTGFNTANKILKISGKVLVVVTVAYATYEIANAENKTKEIVKQGVVISGGVAGTALAGLAVSSVCGPGAPFCAIGLMLAGGVASGWAASRLADSLDDEIEEFTKWNVG